MCGRGPVALACDLRSGGTEYVCRECAAMPMFRGLGQLRDIRADEWELLPVWEVMVS